MKHKKILFFFLGISFLVSTFVLFPIKGTTLVNLLSLLVFAMLLLKKDYYLCTVLLVFLCYYLISQTLNILFEVQPPSPVYLLEHMCKIDYLNFQFIKSHFTQSLYLIPCLGFFFVITRYYTHSDQKYFNYGVLLVCVYGLFEVLTFLLFDKPYDFLSNRVYGDGNTEAIKNQIMWMNGIKMVRLESLTMEPSFFALTISPFWAYYKIKGNRILEYVTFTCLILSTSSVAYFGFIVYLIQWLITFYHKAIKKAYVTDILIMSCVFIAIIIIKYSMVESFVGFMIDKIQSKHVSGVQRLGSIKAGINYWVSLPILSQIVGVGFGSVKSTDMFTTLLLNVGGLGLLLSIIIFLVPIIKKTQDRNHLAIKFALIQVLFISLSSVSDHGIYSIWFFLALGYQYVCKDFFYKFARLKLFKYA